MQRERERERERERARRRDDACTITVIYGVSCCHNARQLQPGMKAVAAINRSSCSYKKGLLQKERETEREKNDVCTVSVVYGVSYSYNLGQLQP